MSKDELPMLRYLFKIPQSIEVRSPEVYERIDWVIPGWVALYELMFKDGMRLPILKLIRDVCDHYLITLSQLMPNAWRILMALESLSVRHGVEHDTDKGRYQLITRVVCVPVVTFLRTNHRSWKDMFFFVRKDLVWGLCGPGGVSGHWKATSKEFLFKLLYFD